MGLIRNTKQREIILNELKKLTSHPTADELYIIVRQHLPNISIATVYRNLEIMANDGIIKRLEISGKQRRYDARMDKHFHIQCKVCGKVEDVEIMDISTLEREIDKIAQLKPDFYFQDYIIDFYGVCSNCQVTN